MSRPNAKDGMPVPYANHSWSSRALTEVHVQEFRVGRGLCVGFEGETGYFRRMLRERFLWVSTTLPSRDSHPTAHSKMGPLASTNFLSCASESSPWVLRTYQMAPAIWPMSSSMVSPILIMLSQWLMSLMPTRGGDETK